jgi:hypothetical protein
MRLIVPLTALLLALAPAARAEELPFFDEQGNPSEALVETLLYPGEFAGRRFIRVSGGDEALYCLDSSLGAREPFAQVYPERLVWPAIGGVALSVDKLDSRLVPAADDVTDDVLDAGFAIRWTLEVLGQDFSRAPVFRLKVVGAEVRGGDGRVLLHWAGAAARDVCTAPASPDLPACQLDGRSLEAQAIAVSPDGTRLALAMTGMKPRIELYDIAQAPRLLWQSTFSTGSGGAVEVLFSADGRWVVALLGNGRIHRFVADTGGRHMGIPSRGTAARGVPPGRLVAVAGKDGELVLWRLSDGTIEWRIPARSEGGQAARIAVSGDGRRIALLEFTDADTAIRVFEVHRRRAVARFTLPGTDWHDIALSGDGQRLFISHETNGLFAAAVDAGGAPEPFGASAAVCVGRIEWRAEKQMLACSTQGGILHVKADGTDGPVLTTPEVSDRWIAAGSITGGITAAIGSGHLLLWR